MILINGSEVTLPKLFLSTDTNAAGVVTNITYPAGTEYSSHTGDGTVNVDGTTWTNDLVAGATPKELEITVIITDIDAFGALAEEDRKVVAVTETLAGETNSADNTQERPILDVPCPDLFTCFNLFAAQIPAFDSMVEAFNELGPDAWFKYTEGNTDGATTGSVHITEDSSSS